MSFSFHLPKPKTFQHEYDLQYIYFIIITLECALLWKSI